MTFSFVQSKQERLELQVLPCERSAIGKDHDDNWLTVQIRVCVGGFRATVDSKIVTQGFVAFLAQLRLLYKCSFGTAEFVTLDRQLHLQLIGDGKGWIELLGEITDQPTNSNRLHFTLHFDQSQLEASIKQLERVTSEFFVRTDIER